MSMPSLHTASLTSPAPVPVADSSGWFLPAGFSVLAFDGRGVEGVGPSMLFCRSSLVPMVLIAVDFLFRGLSRLLKTIYIISPSLCYFFFAYVSSVVSIVCFFALLLRKRF